MPSDSESSPKLVKGWAEHTVVANLPRRLPGAPPVHQPLAALEEPRTLIGMPRPQPPEPPRELNRPLAALEEPRTVVGAVPSRATAQQLIARYAALSSPPAPAESEPPEPAPPPQRRPWFRRLATFARNDFRRAPPVVRLLLPALPLIAAVTTFLDVDPSAPAASRAMAVAATTIAPTADPPPAAPTSLPLPVSSVAIVRHPERTLAADAADAVARGDRRQAIAIYAQLAREHPEQTAFASAARILSRDEERDRPESRR
jgi:hypothetical protein